MKLTPLNKKEESPDVVSFIFNKPDADFSWLAGQFLHYTLPHAQADDRKTERYFTIASAPHEGNIMITTRFAGQDKSSSFKKALFAMKIGDTIEAAGPDGDFILSDPNKTYIFIAGGIGITPYHSILLDMDHKNLPMNVTLLYASKNKDNVVYKDELEALAAKHPTFKIHYFFNTEQIDEAAIKNIVPDLARPIFYVSGPEPMVEMFEKMLPQMGIPEDSIKKDYFPGYDWP